MWLKWRLFSYYKVYYCCILSFEWVPCFWILFADVSEHSVCSTFVGDVSRKNSSQLFFLLTPPTKMEQTECSETSENKIQTPGKHPKAKNIRVIFIKRRKFEIKYSMFVIPVIIIFRNRPCAVYIPKYLASP